MIKELALVLNDALGRLLTMENTSNILVQDHQQFLFGRSFYLTWVQTIPLVFLTCVTLVANGAVLLMFILTKSLRRCRNIYIASLALADFLIGCTMPVSMLENVKLQWSPIGVWCQLHLISRYSLLYVSLLSILLISVDRWWSINYPFSYRVRQSRRLAVCAVTVSWILSFGIHIPPIVIWNEVNNESTSINSNNSLYLQGCEAPYRQHFIYLLVSSIVEYLFPLVALWILNCSIYFRISQRKSIKIRRSMSVTDTLYLGYRKSSSESEGNNYGSDENSDLCPQLPNGRRTSYVYKSNRRHSLSNCIYSKNHLTQFQRNGLGSRRVSFDIGMSSNMYSSKRPISRKCSLSSIIGKNSVRKQSDDLVRDLLVKQDKKAACSLGMMVIVFTVCWTPHMVAEIINSRCGHCISPIFVTVTFWILVANSAINPFLYGLLNAEFRKAFKQWLYCNPSRKFRIKEAVMYWNIMPMNTELMRENGMTCVNAVKDWPS